MLIPWCAADYRMTFCKQKAKELRASGKFRRVVVRKKADEFFIDEGFVAMAKPSLHSGKGTWHHPTYVEVCR